MKRIHLTTPLIAISSLLFITSSALANNSVAPASASGESINFSPTVSSAIVLEVTNGFQFAYREVFADNSPSFSTTQDGVTLVDGQYTYQQTGSTAADGNGPSVRQSGTFEVTSGTKILDHSSAEN